MRLCRDCHMCFIHFFYFTEAKQSVIAISISPMKLSSVMSTGSQGVYNYRDDCDYIDTFP